MPPANTADLRGRGAARAGADRHEHPSLLRRRPAARPGHPVPHADAWGQPRGREIALAVPRHRGPPRGASRIDGGGRRRTDAPEANDVLKLPNAMNSTRMLERTSK